MCAKRIATFWLCPDICGKWLFVVYTCAVLLAVPSKPVSLVALLKKCPKMC